MKPNGYESKLNNRQKHYAGFIVACADLSKLFKSANESAPVVVPGPSGKEARDTMNQSAPSHAGSFGELEALASTLLAVLLFAVSGGAVRIPAY